MTDLEREMLEALKGVAGHWLDTSSARGRAVLDKVHAAIAKAERLRQERSTDRLEGAGL